MEGLQTIHFRAQFLQKETCFIKKGCESSFKKNNLAKVYKSFYCPTYTRMIFGVVEEISSIAHQISKKEGTETESNREKATG